MRCKDHNTNIRRTQIIVQNVNPEVKNREHERRESYYYKFKVTKRLTEFTIEGGNCFVT